jgi:hypothetical protein
MSEASAMLALVTLPLALTGDQWITLAGVLSGAIGVVGGFVFAYVNGKAERLHSRQLALSARLHEQRLAAYVEIGRFLERQYLYVKTVERVWHVPVQVADPPEMPSVDDWTMVMGKAKVSASAGVLEAFQEAQNTTYMLDYAIADRKAALQDPEVEQFERELGMGAPHTLAVEEARLTAMTAIKETEQRMREELAAAT